MFNIENGPFTGMTGPSATNEFPDVLTYQNARSHIWKTPAANLVLGVNGNNEPLTVDLEQDSPHILVSAGSGAGKSVIARSLATQALVKGATVAFLDVKEISHRWAYNLPEVHYASDIEKIANALVSVAAEVKRRMRVIRDFPGPVEDADIGPRVLIIAEELNGMIEALKDFERGLPLRGVYRPTRAFADIMNLGRAAKVHMVGFAQYPDGTIVPKRLMESFGTRVLIRHTPESWRMLAWHLGYPAPSSQHPGRGMVVQGDKGVGTQFLYLSEEECAQLVRDAYAARERMGLVPSRGDRWKTRLGQKRELTRMERGA